MAKDLICSSNYLTIKEGREGVRGGWGGREGGREGQKRKADVPAFGRPRTSWPCPINLGMKDECKEEERK